MDLFHTRIGPALSQGSTWAGIAAALVVYVALMPDWAPYFAAAATGCGVVAVVLKG